MSSPHPIPWSAFVIAFFTSVPGALAEEVTGPPSKGSRDGRPNIILILADDLGYECLGCNGGRSYETPNIDALAASGVRFTHCYATPAGPSSRAELMTGRYGFRTGWTGHIENSRLFLDGARHRTIAQVLKSAGYVTAVAGKWQLGDFVVHKQHPFACGFDEWNLWTPLVGGQPTSRYWNPVIWRDGALRDGTAGRYGPDVGRDFVLDFISRHRHEPFFVYYPTTLVHAPFEETPRQRTDRNVIRRRAAAKESQFRDMVAYLDEIVGSIVDTVDALQLGNQTLILFTSDNGTDRSIHSRVADGTGEKVIQGGKLTTTARGIHVPLIARGFGVKSHGVVSDELVDFSDFLPTLAELSGVKIDPKVGLDGQSFLSILRDETGPRREWVYSQLGKVRLVRDRRYVLYEDGRQFDVESDPDQKKPLVAGTDLDADEARQRLADALTSLQ